MANQAGNTDKLNPHTLKPIRVLITDDSATVRHHLMHMIDETPGLRVVGQAKDGEEALALIAALKPDVVSMDINMPRMDGLEATRRIMEAYPTPVVIVSGLVERDIQLSFQAIEAGALAVVTKPPDRHHPAFADKQRQLVRTLSAMARVSVIRRRGPLRAVLPGTGALHFSPLPPELIAIGASAGGPAALHHLLAALPAALPVPLVVVQHIPPEFVNGLARWLGEKTAFDVGVVAQGQPLRAGRVYFSPGMAHLGVLRRKETLHAHLIQEKGAYRYQPSVDHLFESVAAVCGGQAVGVILTGMGSDGAAGLLAMRQAGAHTLAQDPQNATVYGMPEAAIACGAAQQVFTLEDLPTAITKLL